MNPLVLELATKAKIQMCSEPRLQEFAQLVAKQCIKLCLENDDPYLAVEIADLFGIKDL